MLPYRVIEYNVIMYARVHIPVALDIGAKRVFFFISVHHASSYLADERTVAAVVVCAPQPLATVGYVHRTVATDCTPRLSLYTTTGHLRPATGVSTESDTFETPRNYPFFPIVYPFFIIIFISPSTVEINAITRVSMDFLLDPAITSLRCIYRVLSDLCKSPVHTTPCRVQLCIYWAATGTFWFYRSVFGSSKGSLNKIISGFSS